MLREEDGAEGGGSSLRTFNVRMRRGRPIFSWLVRMSATAGTIKWWGARVRLELDLAEELLLGGAGRGGFGVGRGDVTCDHDEKFRQLCDQGVAEWGGNGFEEELVEDVYHLEFAFAVEEDGG